MKTKCWCCGQEIEGEELAVLIPTALGAALLARCERTGETVNDVVQQSLAKHLELMKRLERDE